MDEGETFFSPPLSLTIYGRQESWVMSVGELAMPMSLLCIQRTVPVPHMGSRIEFALVVGVAGELDPTDWESWQANSDTTQAQIQSFELTHPNITQSMNCWSKQRGWT